MTFFFLALRGQSLGYQNERNLRFTIWFSLVQSFVFHILFMGLLFYFYFSGFDYKVFSLSDFIFKITIIRNFLY